MNKRQLEVQKTSLKNEQKVIRELKQVYEQARKDCERTIAELSARTDMQNIQSIVYQKQYQEALKKQLDSVLDSLNNKQFTTVAEYVAECYETGFFGTLYDLQGQGVPLIFPINQEQVAQAIQIDTKLSTNLYSKMGEDVSYLKKSVRAEVSRGIAEGASWSLIASRVAKGMNSPFNKSYNNAVRIARTEGHRVQQEATFHCQQKAKAKGADIVKQWDSTLDGRTRPTHRELDGQIQELEDPFVVPSSGASAMYPSDFGSAKEDINCRCCVLQRAKWGLDEEEFFTKYDGDKRELVEIEGHSFEKFKEQAKEVITYQGHPDCKVAKAMGAENYKNFLDVIEKCPEKSVRKFWDKMEEQIEGDFSYKGHPHCTGRKINLNVLNDAKGSSWQNPFQVLCHESGHLFDSFLKTKVSGFGWGVSARYKNGIFGDTIREEISERITQIDKALKAEYKLHKDDVDWMKSNGFWNWFSDSPKKYAKAHAYEKFQDEIRKIPREARADISDIVEGATNAKVRAGFGHGVSYWKDKDNLPAEAFAEMTDATLTNPKNLEQIKKYLPRSYEIYLEMIDELLK